MDLELAGKTAIVTGGGRGIGKAIARQLALEGVDVGIVARTRVALETTAGELAAETNRRVIPITADTGDDTSVRAMVQEAAARFEHLDILVNCAAVAGGAAPSPKLAEITDDAFYPDINVKVMGYLRCAREVAPYMQRRGWGRIISLGGMAARTTGAIITSVRNVAVVSLSKNLADELGPYGINVTAVHPGMTRTEAVEARWALQAEREGVSVEEIERRVAEGSPVRRVIDARDVANVVAFLASPKSIAINGDVIGAAGGLPRAIYY
ncbi:MAG: SDR family oxidoreductase [Chloroflexi bacterium]|nr:SDR family oxidoreductase [Chloroflexota bacterium]